MKKLILITIQCAIYFTVIHILTGLGVHWLDWEMITIMCLFAFDGAYNKHFGEMF